MESNLNIKLIENPSEDLLHNEELAQVLGGWNCGSYTQHSLFSATCSEWNSGACSDSSKRNYCVQYTKGKGK